MAIGLTPKQRQFCEEYLIDLDPGAAYSRAYQVEHTRTAKTSAYELLKNPKITTYLSALQKKRRDRIHVTGDRVVSEVAAIAFSRLTDIFEFQADANDGEGLIRYRSTRTMPESVKAVLSEVTATTTTRTNRGETETSLQLKIKMHNKMQALTLLSKLLGLDFNGAVAAVTRAGYLVVDPTNQRMITPDTDLADISVDFSEVDEDDQS